MWGWNVRVNGMRSVFSFWGVCSADCRSIRLGAVVAHLNDGNSIATLYNGQFTLSTQLIVLNYPVILSHRRGITVSLEAYPLLFCWSVVTIQNTLFPEESQISEKSVYRINWGSSTEKKCSSRYLDNHNRHLSLACSSARSVEETEVLERVTRLSVLLRKSSLTAGSSYFV